MKKNITVYFPVCILNRFTVLHQTIIRSEPTLIHMNCADLYLNVINVQSNVFPQKENVEQENLSNI